MKVKNRLIGFCMAFLLTLGVFVATPDVNFTVSAEDITVKEIVSGLDYDEVYNFSEGLACVKKDDKYGVIDKTGSLIVPCEYDWIGYSTEGMIPVKKGDKWGLVDKTGSLVVPLEYDELGYFNEGLTYAKKGDKWGYINKTGSIVIPLEYNVACPFSEGIALVNKDNKYFYIDKTGKIALSLDIYGFQGYLNEGMLVVSNYEYEHPYGCINKNGEVVVPFAYDLIYGFHEGFSVVGIGRSPDTKRGVIDKTGKVIVPLGKYNWIEDFKEGLAVVSNERTPVEYECGYIDQTGKLVIPLIYDSAKSFSEGLAFVGKDNKYGYVDKAGAVIVPLIYEWVFADNICYFSEGLSVMAKGTYSDLKYGYIDKTGKEIVSFSYDKAQPFSEGLSFVKKGNTWSILEIVKSSTPTTPTKPETPTTSEKTTATSTASTLYFDGRQVSIDGYTIKDNNYFKLRDLAYILNGTSKQFQVGWDATNNAISLTSNKPYTPVGGEMVGQGIGNKTATPTRSTIYLDGKQISLTAYEISGNNYFKLRDIGQTFNFNVSWDGVNNAISVNTNEGYATTDTPQSQPQQTQTNTNFKDGETYTYYKNGVAMYRLTLKKGSYDKSNSEYLVDKNGVRILHIEYEYENLNYDKSIQLTSTRFIGIDKSNNTVKPTTSVNGFYKSEYNLGVKKTTKYSASNGKSVKSGAKSTGTLFLTIDDSSVSSFTVKCEYSSVEGLQGGVMWDFNLN